MFSRANFDEGIISQDDLKQMIAIQDPVTAELIQAFPETISPRYPKLVGIIEKAEKKGNLITRFYPTVLKEVFDRAGALPFICLACSGRYQSGKSGTLAGLTGNWGHLSGDGVVEQTNGVFIDGPYTLEHFYKRFGIKPTENLFFSGNEYLTPLVFVFDIEGYGGKIHGIKSDINNAAFIKLCTPFLCISSAFFFMSESNPAIDEISKIIDFMQISNLTINSNIKGNGGLKLIIGIKNYNFRFNSKIVTKEFVLDKICEAESKLQSKWIGIDNFKNNGIVIEQSPMINPESIWFSLTFSKFGEKIIRSIENASQGNYMRNKNECMILFQYIIEHYKDKTFKDDIKNKITDCHNKSMRAIAFNAMNECIEKYKKEFDELLKSYKKNYHEDYSLEESISDYKDKSNNFMEKKLNVISDSSDVINYMQQATEIISQYIREQFFKYQKEKEESLMDEYLRKLLKSNQKNEIKSNFVNHVKTKYSNILTNIVDLRTLQLREELKNKEYYLSYYKNTKQIKYQISQKFNEKISNDGKDIINNCRNEFGKLKEQNIDYFNEIYEEIKDDLITNNVIDDIFYSHYELIEQNINEEFKDAREHLSVKTVEKKKVKSKKFWVIPIIEVYKKTITTYPEGVIDDSGYILTKKYIALSI